MNEVAKKIKENYEISKKLNEENDKIYTDIVCYIRGSSLNELDQEEVISDILDMFLRCQEENKPIEEAIGEDYKGFCDSVIEAAGNKKFSFHNTISNIKMIISCFFILLTIDLAFFYLPRLIKVKKAEDYKFSLSFLIAYIIIMFISISIVKYILKNSFNISESVKSKKKIIIFSIGYYLVIVLLILINYKLRKITLFSLKIYYPIIAIIIYWIYIFAKKIYISRSVRIK